MSVKQIVDSAVAFDSNVAKSVVELVKKFADVVFATFGGDEIEKDKMDAMLDGIEERSTWKGTKSRNARRSEWKAAINASAFNFGAACDLYHKKYGAFNRVVMFKLARVLPWHEHTTDAVREAYKACNSKPAKAKPATLASAVKSVLRAGGRKRNEIAFRKALAALAKKHGIDLS